MAKLIRDGKEIPCRQGAAAPTAISPIDGIPEDRS